MLDSEDVEDIFEPSLFVNTSYELEEISIGEVVVKLYALHKSATTDHDLTGQILWPAAKILSLYLTQCGICRSASVLELGAGSGLAGLVAANLLDDPSKVMLTDNNELVLDLLRRNVDANFCHRTETPRCEHLSWGVEEVDAFIGRHGTYDVILGADVVFWPSAVPLLIQTVHRLLTKQPTAKFFLSYINRSRYTTKLLQTVADKSGLQLERIELEDEAFREILRANKLDKDQISLFLCTLR